MNDTLFNGKYRIPSARASWHNYDGGMYFITICTIGHSLGRIENGKMQLSPIGTIVQQNLQNINAHYPYAEIPLFVVMPNHVHAIVVIDGGNNQCRDVARNISTGAVVGCRWYGGMENRKCDLKITNTDFISYFLLCYGGNHQCRDVARNVSTGKTDKTKIYWINKQKTVYLQYE